MNASFLDTSVVIRYFTEATGAAADAAQRIIEGSERLIVSELVLTEAAHVLTSFYKVPREKIVDGLVGLVGRHNIVPLSLSKESVFQALDLCRPSHRVSFVDAFLWAQAKEEGAERIFTFDRRIPDQDLELVHDAPD